jgi:hypothetical protein
MGLYSLILQVLVPNNLDRAFVIIVQKYTVNKWHTILICSNSH